MAGHNCFLVLNTDDKVNNVNNQAQFNIPDNFFTSDVEWLDMHLVSIYRAAPTNTNYSTNLTQITARGLNTLNGYSTSTSDIVFELMDMETNTYDMQFPNTRNIETVRNFSGQTISINCVNAVTDVPIVDDSDADIPRLIYVFSVQGRNDL